MHRIEADFNDLARGGKVRVDLDDVPRVQTGGRVLLIDPAEGLKYVAVLAEASDDYAYFTLLKRVEGAVSYTEFTNSPLANLSLTATVGGIPAELTHIVQRPARPTPVRVGEAA